MNPEIIIYIEKFKKFLSQNQESRDYFLSEIDENIFFECLIEIAEKNFEKYGEPSLDRDQLNDMRTKLLKKNVEKFIKDSENIIGFNKNIFVSVSNFGYFCLN